MGRWSGLALNLASLVFLAVFFTMSFFPISVAPALADMNWAILMFGGVIIFALAYYLVTARKIYDGPVEYVRKGI